jgi:LuxR family maltose regulon positive regulatory protein
MTVCQERRRRGGSYWYAYRHRAQKVVKKYLGRSRDLTVWRLEEVAHQLQQVRDGEVAPAQRSSVPLAMQFVSATHAEKSTAFQQTPFASHHQAFAPIAPASSDQA